MKYWEFKKLPCKTASHHYYIRKFVKNLQTRGCVGEIKAFLIVLDEVDPCKTYIIIENMDGSTGKHYGPKALARA